ncbi:MAG: PAS domain-containing protein [Candidatus Izemoplasmatales bacterium]
MSRFFDISDVVFTSHVLGEELVFYIGIIVITVIITCLLTYVYLTDKTRRNMLKHRFDFYHNYLSLLESFNGMAYRCLNDDKWTMKYVSKKTYELIGYLEEEIIDNKAISFEDIIHPKYREMVRNDWDKSVAKHEDFYGEYIIITKKNEEKWVSEVGHAIYDEHGQCIYIEGFITDISKHKELMISERKMDFRYRNLIENSAEAIYIAEDGVIVYTNPACLSFFKAKTPNDLLGKRIEDIITERYEQFYHDRIARIAQTHMGNPVAEYEFKRFDGTLAYAEVTSSPYFDNDHFEVYVFIHDITDKKRSESAIKKIQKRNRDLIIEMSEGIGVFSRNSNSDFHLVFQNKNFTTNLFGEFKKIVNTEFEKLVSFIPKEELPEIYDVITSDLSYTNKFRMKNRTLEVRFFTNVDHELVMMVKDISAIENAYLELKHQMDRQEKIINGTNTGTWEWDIVTGLIEINDKWAEMLGYTTAELKPTSITTWEKLVDPADLEEVNRMLDLHFTKKTDSFSHTYRMIHKDGHSIWVLDKGSVSEWDEDKPLKMFGTRLDVTLAKEREMELEYVSNHDYLTGLYNRRAYENYLVQVNHNDNYPICLIMADVNQLKYINDTYGHQAGDDLLCKVSQVLTFVCRPHFLARIGGDEFMIIIKNSTKELT